MTDFKKWFAARARNPDRITLEEAFAAGARSQCAPSIPEGWKLVPIEPTGEMVAAGSWGAAAGMRDPDVVELWKDMLAAAPEAKHGWLRAIDEALIVAHIGVANESDTYEQAKVKLDNLIGFHVSVATDPAVNGGWQLAPIVPLQEMSEAGVYAGGIYYDVVEAVYEAMLGVAAKIRSEEL